ncbi:hypothetical protein GCM10007424_24280 [Flavobacterium suaedae]|uniref:DUF2059 domain-containing protein n=1 Tax=Flavobacterium suaedae TaxID=1767027 RepID=A0ABQ1K4V1_9FLAO|nr:DUF2059 domain-containing protein [Flavobacterium suaedae]GGB83388.1 hypothetical protein GCM10007424_24280 [Flavobacterium suaedae]
MANAQIDEKIHSLISITTDTERLEGIKELMLYDVLDIEREAFSKEFDIIVFNYYKKLQEYYKANYTEDEIDQLLSFYDSPAGKKLMADQRELLHGNLLPNNDLNARVKEIKKDK